MPRTTWLIGVLLAAGSVVALALAAQARRVGPALGAFDAWGGVPAWGQTVGGLRARLFADRRRYGAGAPMILVLEIQNVGGRTVLLTAPHLMPSIDMADEDRLQRAGGYNTLITAEPLDDGEFIIDPVLHADELVRRSPVRLAPNAVFTMVVHSEGEIEDQLMRLEKVEQMPQPRRAEAHHWFARRPGRYRLVAKITMPAPAKLRDQPPIDDAGRWRGTLITRPIEVDVLPSNDD